MYIPAMADQLGQIWALDFDGALGQWGSCTFQKESATDRRRNQYQLGDLHSRNGAQLAAATGFIGRGFW